MTISGWKFKGKEGVFRLEQPELSSYLYFPLVNEAGMMSSVSPTLHGQSTTGHNSFLLEPISVEPVVAEPDPALDVAGPFPGRPLVVRDRHGQRMTPLRQVVVGQGPAAAGQPEAG